MIIVEIEISIKDFQRLECHSAEYIGQRTWKEMITMLLEDSKQKMIVQGFMKQHTNYAEDALTEEENYSYRISMNSSLI